VKQKVNRGWFLFAAILLALLATLGVMQLGFWSRETSPIEPEQETFRIGAQATIHTTNPSHIPSHLAVLVFDPVVFYIVNSTGQQRGIPVGLERLEVSDDGMSCDFILRKGMLFHDGSEVTADDTAFSISKFIADIWMANQPRISIEIIDTYTIRLRSDQREDWSSALQGLWILNREHEESSKRDRHDTMDLIGSGPYKFISYDSKDKIVLLERWDKYWGGRPKYKFIEVHLFNNSDAETMALLEGKIDFANDVSQEDIALIGRSKRLNTFKYSTDSFAILIFNQNLAKFSDQRVRKAISLLIDREKLVEHRVGLNGAGVATDIMFHPFPPVTKPELTEDWNPERASQLLEEAGWKLQDGKLKRDGEVFDLKISGYSSGKMTQKGVMRLIAKNLHEAGFSVELKLIDHAHAVDSVSNHNFEILLCYWYDISTTSGVKSHLENEQRYYQMAKDRRLKEIVYLMQEAREAGAGEERMLELKRKLQLKYRDLAWNLPLFYFDTFAVVRGKENLNKALLMDPRQLTFFTRPAPAELSVD